jgi:hypothetical protein
MVTACCNACRTCMTSNALTIVFAGFSGLAVGARRLARRFANPA